MAPLPFVLPFMMHCVMSFGIGQATCGLFLGQIMKRGESYVQAQRGIVALLLG